MTPTYKKYLSENSLYISLMIFIVVNIFLPTFINGYSTSLSIDPSELYNNDNFQNLLNKRFSDRYFSTRIVTSNLVVFLNKYCNIPFQLSYNLIISASIATMIWCFKKIAEHLNVGTKWSIPAFFLFFPVLFCHCSMLAGFDDFLHWTITLLIIVCLMKSNYFLAFLLFFIAVLCREAIVFIIPFLVSLFKSGKVKAIVVFGFLTFLGLFIIKSSINIELIQESYLAGTRDFQLRYNFIEYWPRTLWVLYSTLFFPLALISEKVIKEKNLLIQSIVLYNLFLLCVIYFDEARASFYLFLPLVVYWDKGLKHCIESIYPFYKNSIIKSIFIFISIVYFSFFIYNPCSSKSCISYQIYASLFLILTLPYMVKNTTIIFLLLKDIFSPRALKNSLLQLYR